LVLTPDGGILTMTTVEPVGLLQVWDVIERPSAQRMVCNARCVSPARGVFLGESVLPVDTPPDDRTAPAQVVRMHRAPSDREVHDGWDDCAPVSHHTLDGGHRDYLRCPPALRDLIARAAHR
jgi:hypothetical protein